MSILKTFHTQDDPLYTYELSRKVYFIRVTSPINRPVRMFAWTSLS